MRLDLKKLGFVRNNWQEQYEKVVDLGDDDQATLTVRYNNGWKVSIKDVNIKVNSIIYENQLTKLETKLNRLKSLWNELKEIEKDLNYYLH